ncbi:MAG: diaminopimelate epimerase [candidate division Zixibacteria bacterium]|nr:diaminopimelate epimerase [candidate division Zixibacteria bacterium]
MKIEFVKMHGLGNDYILVNSLKGNLGRTNIQQLAKNICHRNLGIGADGIILVLSGKNHPFQMRIYNSDGTQAEMCGNGIRCFARYLYEYGVSRKRKQKIETLAGLIETEIVNIKGDFLVKVNMGKPILVRNVIPVKGSKKFCINENLKVNRKVFNFTAISMGNPHAVIFVKEFNNNWQKWGKMIENHPLFPKKTNVEFVRLLNRRKIELRVWERGAGPTLACGTGACAAVVAGILSGKLNRKSKVDFPLGQLLIEWSKKDNCVFMTGPAERVCEGIYNY